MYDLLLNLPPCSMGGLDVPHESSIREPVNLNFQANFETSSPHTGCAKTLRNISFSVWTNSNTRVGPVDSPGRQCATTMTWGHTWMWVFCWSVTEIYKYSKHPCVPRCARVRSAQWNSCHSDTHTVQNSDLTLFTLPFSCAVGIVPVEYEMSLPRSIKVRLHMTSASAFLSNVKNGFFSNKWWYTRCGSGPAPPPNPKFWGPKIDHFRTLFIFS